MKNYHAALIIGTLATIFGGFVHYATYKPAEWGMFVMWTPLLFAVPLCLAFLMGWSE